VDIVVKGRNVEVPDHYREHVADKLARVERYDHKLIRIDVELFHERNPRQKENCQRVEITCKSRGPVVRSESCAADFYTALDTAITRLESRLRRAADRRRVHHGRHTPISVAAATAAVATGGAALAERVAAPAGLDGGSPDGRAPALSGAATRTLDGASADGASADGAATGALSDDGAELDLDEHVPGRVVREKEHPGVPMTLDQALFEMELVGHDFYLFSDADTGRPSVVYRRKGFDYGVIRLAP